MKFFTGSLFLGSKKLLSAPHLKPDSLEMFSDWAEYAHCLIDSINETVGENDELYILGNFATRKPGKHRRRIKCRNIRLIHGDTDPHMACKDVFGPFPDISTVKLNRSESEKGIKAMLSHYPMAYWEGSHRGRFHLYARPKDKREQDFRALLPHGHPSFNCSVDHLRSCFGNYCPISEVKLLEILEKKKS
jgi:calcineurin-like phosphoesterase family protein